MTIRQAIPAFVLAVLLLVPAVGPAQSTDDVFDPDVLHDVFLRINTRDLELLRANYDVNTYYPADIQWGTAIARNVAIRSRGYGSRSANKLGLRVDIDHFVSGQQFAGVDSLVLDNLNQDASMVREHAAMALFTRMGQAAPRTSFARLFINGQYQGVYGLVEEPNEQFVERRFGADRGYLFEYHWRSPYYFDDLGEDLTPYREIFEPRTRELTAPGVLYSPLRELVRAEEGESLNDWRDRVSTYLDLNQLVTMVAIEEFLSEFDGLTGAEGTNNFYLYRPHGSERHIFVPWDRDNAFHHVDSPIYLRTNENRLIRQALAFPDLHALYLEQLAEAARISSDEDWLERTIQQADSLVSASALEDPRKPFTNEERENAMRTLIDFSQRRSSLVLEQIREAQSAPPSP
jgi:spore coat protein CotH